MKIYHNPRCSKSRQTLSLLNENNCDFEIVEYLKNTPSKKELLEVLDYLKVDALQIIRKKEEDFKPFKGMEKSNEEWVDIMIQYPKLIERPIVISNGKAAIGRPPETVLDII